MAPATSLRLVALVVVLAALPAAASATGGKGKQYKVGGNDGWRLPPPEIKEMYYANWASSITFHVGDSIEFVYKNDSAIKVDKVVYYHCTTPAADDSGAPAPHDGSRVFPLDTPGYAYFASADLERCKLGERLMINVLPAGGQPGAPGPGMPAPGPSTGGAGRSIAPSSVRAVVLAVVAGLL